MSEKHADKSVAHPKTALHIKKITIPFILFNALIAHFLYKINLGNFGIDLSFIDNFAPSFKYLAQPDGKGQSNRLYALLVWVIGYLAIFKPATQEGPNTQSRVTRIEVFKGVGISLFSMALALYVYFFALTEKIKYSGRDSIIPTLISEGPAGAGLLLSFIVWFFYLFLIIFVAYIRKFHQNGRTK